jgi:hypothetical protein
MDIIHPAKAEKKPRRNSARSNGLRTASELKSLRYFLFVDEVKPRSPADPDMESRSRVADKYQHIQQISIQYLPSSSRVIRMNGGNDGEGYKTRAAQCVIRR